MMQTKLTDAEQGKKVWTAPKLIVHGDVEGITKESSSSPWGSSPVGQS
jgi:hypothetical protein